MRDRFQWICLSLFRWVFALIFVSSAASKVENLDSFSGTLHRVLDAVSVTVIAAGPVAYAVIIWEAFLGWWILTSTRVASVAIAIAVTLIVFSAALAILRVAGRNSTCGCGGLWDWGPFPMTATGGLIRNAILLCLLAIFAFCGWRREQVKANAGIATTDIK